MRVEPKDGACRSCGGPLDILDSDDCSMTVACADCGDNYDLETDAFGDGCMSYYVPFATRRITGGGDEG